MFAVTRSHEWWWLLAIAGVVDILFGLTALVYPGLTLAVLILLFGVYAIVLGLVELSYLFRPTETPSARWTYPVIGVISILAGIAAFAWPGETTVVLLYIIGVWAIVVGVMEISAGIMLNRLWATIAGILAVIFGFVIFARPAEGILAMVTVLGVFAIVRGIMRLVGAVVGVPTLEVGAPRKGQQLR